MMPTAFLLSNGNSVGPCLCSILLSVICTDFLQMVMNATPILAACSDAMVASIIFMRTMLGPLLGRGSGFGIYWEGGVDAEICVHYLS